MTKKRLESLWSDLKLVMGGNLFYAKLCMHIKITSVRSYKKQWCVETQTQTNSYDEVYFLNDWNLMCDYWCSVDRKGKLTCENSLYYSWINYFSATSITRTKVIFHSMNVFVNLVKLIQRVKKREEKERTMFFQ